MLTTPFNKMQAFKFGFIDKNGTRIKKIEDENGKMVRNDPVTTKEKSSLTPLHRLVFNLKKIIEKVPFGKTQFASYVTALLLLKEECELDDEQSEELYEKFYRFLKDNELLEAEMITETINIGKLELGETYNIRFPIKEQGEIIHQHKDQVLVHSEYEKIYGIQTYIGFVNDERVVLTADDVY
jgi:hypothetical protein|tara:strand:- start:18 stop:566 length:549 start_codon:yes stop_codon:yes gene_type:complete